MSSHYIDFSNLRTLVTSIFQVTSQDDIWKWHFLQKEGEGNIGILDYFQKKKKKNLFPKLILCLFIQQLFIEYFLGPCIRSITMTRENKTPNNEQCRKTLYYSYGICIKGNVQFIRKMCGRQETEEETWLPGANRCRSWPLLI